MTNKISPSHLLRVFRHCFDTLPVHMVVIFALTSHHHAVSRQCFKIIIITVLPPGVVFFFACWKTKTARKLYAELGAKQLSAGFSVKEIWPSYSPELTPLDYHVWSTSNELQKYCSASKITYIVSGGALNSTL